MFLMEQENQPTTNIIPDLIQTPKNEQGIFDDVDDEDLNLYIAKKADALSLTQEEMQDQDKQAERLEAEAAKTTPTKTKTKYEDEVAKAAADVRQSAEKLLAWRSYRSGTSSLSHNGDYDHSRTTSQPVQRRAYPRENDRNDGRRRYREEPKEDRPYRRKPYST
eukprot:GHVN01066644.1.p1 GENE.GHVN01066644.1~~GHVN01066644.1.p1  ORF type:complete len:164 (+),score=17.17 GHVN01066644.1:735-1226(+)